MDRVFGVVDYEKVYQFRAVIDDRIKEIDEDIKKIEAILKTPISNYETISYKHSLYLLNDNRLKFVDMLHKFTQIMDID